MRSSQSLALPPAIDGETWDHVALRRYPEVEAINHVHTAGNASGIVDGAAAVLLASDDYVKAHGLKGRARIRATATYGSEPVIMLTAPAPASKRALEKPACPRRISTCGRSTKLSLQSRSRR